MARQAKKKGKLIVLEGSDGSGKATQTRLLARRLRAEGYAVERIDFPGYKRAFFGRMAAAYLRGEYGAADPRLAAVLYAGDRFEARDRMLKWLAEGKVVLCDRYVDSNKAHQAARLPADADRKAFFRWVDSMEYGVFKLPRQDCVIFLHVPARVAEDLIDRKGRRAYLRGRKRDAHEADGGHLDRASSVYRELAKRRGRRNRLVECLESGTLLSKKTIHERVYKAVKRALEL